MTQSPAQPKPPATTTTTTTATNCATQPDGTPVARPGQQLALRLHVPAWGGYAWSIPGMNGGTITEGYPHGWRASGESHPHCCLDWSVLRRITPAPAATYTIDWTVPADTPAGLISFPVNGGRLIGGRGVMETIGHLHIEVAAAEPEPSTPTTGLVNRGPEDHPRHRTIGVDESFDLAALVGNDGSEEIPAGGVNLTFEIVDESRVGIASLATFTVLLVTNQGRYEFTAQEESRTRVRCEKFNRTPLAPGDTHHACLDAARALTGARPGDTFTIRTTVDTGEDMDAEAAGDGKDDPNSARTGATSPSTVQEWHYTVK
ncbi:hypothetical protein HUT18_15295 [Streptomyces sp. NA04227]|uniref:hypothetical protein n=1 Tax=Streptomyces sp. NA04227 TaxID=2742136 RepID=UPI0015927896|nr:hypothetical protein [Streptomyces sp. NA04227]QKW07544.1 hypothetical protein HUT18_15295 [Streptomyces sp. NA04227]